MTSLLFPELSNPQAAFGFPTPLSEKYRPQSIADFAGLSEPKRILAGFARNPSNCGFIFLGPAGTGKTSMALALASELQAFVHHIPSQNCTVDAIARVAFSCNYYPPAGFKRHMVIVDEADCMSPAAQLAMLSKLDGTDPVPDTVFVFTCNAVDRLADRFTSRNRVLNFSTYAIQSDAAALLESVWDAEAPADAARPNFARLIKDATGNVRADLMSLEMKLLAA